MPGFFLAEGETVCGGGGGGGGGRAVSIAYITQSFHKFIVSLFCLIPTPMWWRGTGGREPGRIREGGGREAGEDKRDARVM